MKRIKLLAIALLMLPTVLQADIPDLKFRRLDTRDGLSNSSILSIMRDSKGFLWIGTPYGLNRYDDYRFRTFYSEAKDTMTLRNNYVDEIYEAYDHKLWLRQGMNYSIFDPKTERGDRHPERTLEKLGVKGGIERLYIDREKHIWVKTYDNGFWHVDPKSKKVHQYKLGYDAQQFNSDMAVSSFAEDGALLYVTSVKGEVLCFDRQHDRIVSKDDYVRQQVLTQEQDCKARVDASGNLWVIANQQTCVFEKRTKHWHHSVLDALRAWGYADLPETINVWDMQCDAEGRYWVATDHGGLYVADPQSKTVRQFLNNKYDESTLSDNTLRNIMRDDLGRMWVGTYMNGINLYTGSLSNFVNLELGNINTICADRRYYWLGTNDKGIIRFDPKTQEQVVYDKQSCGIRSNTMVGSWAASDGSVWFGTYEGGLIRIKDGQVTNLTATGDPAGLVNNNVWTVCEDQWHNIWIGTLGGGVQRIDKRTGRMKTVNMQNSKIPSDYISTITMTKKGWLMVAHSRFFSLLNPKTMKVVNRDATKNPNGVLITETSITGMEDSRELNWQGTASGATIYDPKTKNVYLIDMKSGLFGSTVNSIIEDDHHAVWVDTDHGVSRIIPQQQEDGTWTFVVRSYNNRDGLQNGPYNQRSMCYTPDGLILVGGQDGLDIINPQQMGKGRIKERPLFSGLQIFDQDVAVGEEVDGRVILDEALDDCRDISLRFNDQFTIQLSSSSGEIHNRSRFVYRLEGFNDNWVKTSELNPNITYNSLRAGSYTLHVRMLNDDGTYGEEESTLDITIRPPLWRTRWMILLYMLLIAAAAWWWRRWFLRRYAKRSEAEMLRHETEKLQWMSEMRHKMHAEAAAASVQPPVREEVHLNSVEQDLVPLVKNLVKAFCVTPVGLEAKVNYRPLVDSVMLQCDGEQLGEALNILLTNSVKFSPGDCQITINLGRTSDHHAMLQVADNGIGIRDEYKEHAFDPIVGGEGIGLDRVKDIIVAHGGTIRLEDNPGGGTIFIISLPAEPEIEIEEAVMVDD